MQNPKTELSSENTQPRALTHEPAISIFQENNTLNKGFERS